jgi:hypothetical protein
MKDMPKTELFNTFAIKGMDLRDYFAAKAMQSFINICYKELDVDKDKAGIVESAYEIADEMLKARNNDS